MKKQKKASKAATTAAPPRKSTGRKCECCTHSSAAEINKAIAAGASFRDISAQFGMGASSVGRHVEKCLKLEIQALIQQKRIENAIDHYQEITEQLEFAKKLRLAAQLYLSDPDDPDCIVLLPRADEIEVIYDDLSDTTAKGEPKRKRDHLGLLLEKAENGNIVAQQTIIKHTDLRDFALNCIRHVDLVLDKVARVEGLYQQDRENREKLARTIKAVNDYLERHPDADRSKVVDAFAAGRGIPRETIQEHLGVIG
jgi:hypothetical protein